MPKSRLPIETIVAPEEQVEYVKLSLLLDVNLYISGNVTGREYHFSGAGASVDVDKRDVEDFLQKRQGAKQCCGSGEIGNQVFELTEK
jgi:hypothetical protein